MTTSRSELPRVTTILKDAGLVDTSFFTDEARDKGSALHLALQFLDQHDLDWDSLDPVLLPRVRQYQRFLDEVRPEILAIEEEVVNEPLQYAGRLDRRVKIAGKELVLDLKTGGCAPFHQVQLAGYAGTFQRPLARTCLHLFEDRYQLVEHRDRNDWVVFKAALTLTAWRRSNGASDVQRTM